MTYALMDTPIGRLELSAENGAVTGVGITGADLVPETDEGCEADRQVLARLMVQLEEYFAGKRRVFDVPVSLTSSRYPAVTPFRRAVWEAMRQIPYGEVRSYGALAAMAGHPGACRAAGNACHVNHLLLVIPCHRVVAADGIGGFGEHIDIKRALLSLEGSLPMCEK